MADFGPERSRYAIKIVQIHLLPDANFISRDRPIRCLYLVSPKNWDTVIFAISLIFVDRF